MPSQSMYLQEGGFSQRNQRRAGTIFSDQHGRKYHAVVELKSGHPTGMIEPRYQAPLIPPQDYLRVGTNPERPYDLTIDYTRWLADLRTAHREYEERAREIARRIYRDQYDPQNYLTEEIVTVMGPKPPHVEVVLAARQGNAYVLGLTDRVDVRLAAMLEEDRPRWATPKDEDEEGDFSEVVTDLDDVIADEEDEAERVLAARRQKDRERKAAKRAERRDPAPAV